MPVSIIATMTLADPVMGYDMKLFEVLAKHQVHTSTLCVLPSSSCIDLVNVVL